MSRYRLSRQADADLDDIAAYVASERPRAALRILDTLHEAFRTLAASPEIGTRREDLLPNLRTFSPQHPASNYIIFYYAFPDGGVGISDVVHGARDWTTLFTSGERGRPPND
jgi:toxin ParE1/3/4